MVSLAFAEVRKGKETDVNVGRAEVLFNPAKRLAALRTADGKWAVAKLCQDSDERFAAFIDLFRSLPGFAVRQDTFRFRPVWASVLRWLFIAFVLIPGGFIALVWLAVALSGAFS